MRVHRGAQLLWVDAAANDCLLLHPLNHWLLMLRSNDFAKLCPFTQRKGFLPKLSNHVSTCCSTTATLCSRSGRKPSPVRGICSGAPATTATLQKSVLFSAGSHGVNTLLLLLLSKPHPCYRPLGSIAREGHQGLKPHSRHAFAASSYLTRCYLTNDVSAASPAGEEREKAGHYWRAEMPPPSVTGKAIAFAEMCVKSPLIPSTSMCPFAVGHAFQSRHPREGQICTPHCQALPKPHQRQASGLQGL